MTKELFLIGSIRWQKREQRFTLQFLKGALKFLKKEFKLLELSHETKLPFKNLYATPKTLGIDRIALVCASVEQFPDNNVLIIDAGSCITFDFINNKSLNMIFV